MDSAEEGVKIGRKNRLWLLAGVYGGAVILAFLVPLIGFGMGKSDDASYLPGCIVVTLEVTWFLSLFIAASPLIALVSSPVFLLIRFFLHRFGNPRLARFLRPMLCGWSCALAICLLITFFGRTNRALDGAETAVLAHYNEVYGRVEYRKSHYQAYNQYESITHALSEQGQKLAMTLRFLDSFFYCTVAGLLFPPFLF